MAAGSTYSTIATTTLSVDTTSITFNSFSGYTDLILIVNGNSAQAGSSYNSLQMRFNGDTAANYSYTYLDGDGTTATSARGSGANSISIWPLGQTSANISTIIVNIMNYANSTTFKTTLARGTNAGLLTEANVGLWRSTSAITSILIQRDGTNQLKAGLTATLYGIAAA